MHDQRDIGYCLGADGWRTQIAVAEFQLRRGVRLGHGEEPRSLGAIAEKAADVGVSMGEEALDDMRSEESARTRNQDFQRCTSG
jgi:hypothetical protein